MAGRWRWGRRDETLVVAFFQWGNDVCWDAVSTYYSTSLFFLGHFWLSIFGRWSLALAETKTLLVAIYQRYSTTLSPEFQNMSPAVTSRFELVYDDSFPLQRYVSSQAYHLVEIVNELLILLLGKRMSCRIQKTINSVLFSSSFFCKLSNVECIWPVWYIW